MKNLTNKLKNLYHNVYLAFFGRKFISDLIQSGLLMFCTVAEPRNSGKSAKSREIHKNTQNTVKFGRNLIKYMSVQQFWNLSQLLGVLLAVSSQIYEQRSKTTRRRLCCEKLGTSHDVKGFAIGSFLECIVVERAMMSSVRKTLKTLVWSAQNRLISCEICPENNHKIRRLFTHCFPAKFTLKIPTKSTDFSAILSPKILRNLPFFPRIIRSPVQLIGSTRPKFNIWPSRPSQLNLGWPKLGFDPSHEKFDVWPTCRPNTSKIKIFN